jgi:hypothetical protein
LALFAINLISTSFGHGMELRNALRELCDASQMFLGAAIMVLIVLAGATYAIGQVLGAETRARATVWATAMLTGAIIGAVVYLVAPSILGHSHRPRPPAGSRPMAVERTPAASGAFPRIGTALAGAKPF